ncbi:hypothetical protein ElyMa_004952600 [Elysia marginata]|uniref:Uncharacterized protein n=1 Tax=Elysia marginata TaxID=1093978 RepID=A0AAV4J2Y3_9GAST|nr:hypothetical protein ElyMa_004952600 [Elysia marginata]
MLILAQCLVTLSYSSGRDLQRETTPCLQVDNRIGESQEFLEVVIVCQHTRLYSSLASGSRPTPSRTYLIATPPLLTSIDPSLSLGTPHP